MAAAVSDYIPAFTQEGKLKKDLLGDEWSLSLKKNIDLLDSIDKEGISVIGFKAEMELQTAKINALNMLKNKKLDAVCLNVLKDASSFGSDTNAIEFITEEASTVLPKNDKLTLSFQILDNAKKLQE
jgi:phosphopantothenoylcysteine decarboxylase/phosphopantothenate--cysteine ligase